MSATNLLIVFYSSTGANYQMAQWAEEGAKSTGANVKLTRFPETAPKEAISSNPAWEKNVENIKDVPEVILDDLEWAEGIIFSAPTRYGSTPSQVQSFLDTTGGLWFSGKLLNKVVSAMTSAQNPHGGQESTILAIYKNMCHWGAIIVAPGYSDKVTFSSGGNPYGTSTTVDQSGKILDDIEEGVKHQAKRTVEIASLIHRKQRF
ncbi:MAG: NAD(P)H:quinone oxidoreductase [Anditalea sp.]